MTDAAQIYEQALAAFNRYDWRGVLERTATLIPMAPNHHGLHYISGVAALELRIPQLAAQHMARATQLDPTNSRYAVQYAKTLIALHRTSEALTVANQAMALRPGDAATLDTLGVVFSFCNAYDRATIAFRHVVELAPDVGLYRFNYATSLISAGDLAAAENELERCLELEPTRWNANLTLAQIRKQTPASNHVPRLENALATAGNDLSASMYLHLALAKELEDLADYPRAFDHLTQGKAAAGKSRTYSSEQDERIFESLMTAFSAPIIASTGFSTDEPIFIIGMPRSGTTLVERIVSSHPEVYSAGELSNFSAVLKQASRSGTPLLLDADTIARSGDLDWEAVGRSYIDSTRPLTGSRPRFIDKLPHNFLYAGFIAKALPKAKIICLRRNPMDSCLSNFRQLFTLTSPFFDYTFDLLDVGRYYVLFDRLMAHWRQVLPDRILEVDYESLVNAQESGSREIISFCGLSWDDACLRFHENAAPVATASAAQVREPMNRKSVDRWRRYEPQLGELMTLLRDAGIAVD